MTQMQTPVFLDQLPDIETVTGQKPAQYRLRRNRALIDLQLDPEVSWQARSHCPGCASSRQVSFSQTLLDYHRCRDCNTIYAARVPAQPQLDRLRLDQPAEEGERSFEFISLLNWISLSETRLGRQLGQVLDLRFSSQAPGWRETVDKLSQHRDWHFLPLQLSPQEEDFADLARALQTHAPQAVLVPAELDRIADPRALLRVLKAHAAPGTVVFFASSCADGLEYEILGADSPSFIPLDRLTVFSIKGFETLARAEGFMVREISTPGRLDAVILHRYFTSSDSTDIPFWSGFFRDADKNRLHDLQILLQRSLRSGVMRFVLEVGSESPDTA